MAGFTESDMPDQRGRCFIVTGANAGIGWEAARALAGRGARVLLGCRNADKAHAAMARIRERTPDADLMFLPLDLADFESVRVAAEIVSAQPRVDVLLNNAGMMTDTYGRTVQGHEMHFGVNHVAPFLFTSLLLPKLAETAGSRVVNTSSLSYRFASIDWDEINSEQNFKPLKRYAVSKLAALTFAVELDRRLRASGSPVSALACHPGFATTEIMGASSGAAGLFAPLASRILNTAAQGAWPSLQAATDPAAVGGGFYGPRQFGGIRGPSGPAKLSARARDPIFARQLWDASAQMAGVNAGLAPASS